MAMPNDTPSDPSIPASSPHALDAEAIRKLAAECPACGRGLLRRASDTGLRTCDNCRYRDTSTLFRTVTERGRERVYLDSIGCLEVLVGPELILGILECGIWTDRLFTLGRLTPKAEDAASAAAMTAASVRDEQALFFLACGCLRELAKSFRALLAAGIEGLIGPDDKHLVAELRTILDRWDARTVFVDVRDKASFHVDRAVLSRGLRYARQSVGSLCRAG
jgi:hypothetical protein